MANGKLAGFAAAVRGVIVEGLWVLAGIIARNDLCDGWAKFRAIANAIPRRSK